MLNKMWLWLNMRHKNTKFIAIRCVLSSSKCSKTHFRRSPRQWPPGRLGNGLGHPFPWTTSSQPSSLAVFGVSNLDVVSALRFLSPPIKSSRYAYFVREKGAQMIFLQEGGEIWSYTTGSSDQMLWLINWNKKHSWLKMRHGAYSVWSQWREEIFGELITRKLNRTQQAATQTRIH